MSSLEGDFAKLRALAADLGSLEKVFRKVDREAKAEAFDQYQTSFPAQRGPMGDRWAPKKHGSGPTLYATGALAQAKVSVRGAGEIQVKAGSYTAAFHQGGWRYGKGGGPARPVLPPQGEGGLWAGPIEQRVVKVVDAAVAKL